MNQQKAKGSGKAPGTNLLAVLQPRVGAFGIPGTASNISSNPQPLGPYTNISYVCTCVRAVCSQSTDDSSRDSIGLRMTRVYPIDTTSFAGLSMLPGHALVDTGAQSGVVGLKCWQIWVAGLAEHGLQPLFIEMPADLEAGGIGGGQKVLAICLMPMGIAGTHALMEWAVVEDPNERDSTPALLSNPFLIEIVWLGFPAVTIARLC